MSDNITNPNSRGLKELIYQAGLKAVQELIKVAEEPILNNHEADLSADKLKNAAMAKRIAIEDAYTILGRIEMEKENDETPTGMSGSKGWAEARTPKVG